MEVIRIKQQLEWRQNVAKVRRFKAPFCSLGGSSLQEKRPDNTQNSCNALPTWPVCVCITPSGLKGTRSTTFFRLSHRLLEFRQSCKSQLAMMGGFFDLAYTYTYIYRSSLHPKKTPGQCCFRFWVEIQSGSHQFLTRLKPICRF